MLEPSSNRQPGSDQVIEVSQLRLEPKAGRMWKGGEPIDLRPKPWDLMLYMASRPGELLSKQELMDAVWPDTVVTESSLNQAIRELRKALGDDARSPRFIETVHRRGFRLLDPEEYTPLASVDEEVLPSAPLFGRSMELEALDSAMQRTRSGHAQFVFVTGEAGIGKTTLVRHFLSGLGQASDLAMGWGQCYDLHGESEAYLPVLEAIDRLARGSRGQVVQDLLSQYAPSWHASFPWMPSPAQGIDRQPQASTPARMLREFCDFIVMVAQEVPVLLWLEDLHWSDAGTIDLLETLGRRTTGSRIMLVGSYRPVDAAIKNAPVAHIKRSLEVAGLASELPLEFLMSPDVGQIVEHRLGSQELPAGLNTLLHEQTSGNPLFVAAALNFLLAEGLLDRRDEGWLLNAPLEVIKRRCPESLRHIVELQRADTGPEEAAALDAASAVGKAFDTQAVAGALNADQLTIEAVLDQLASREQFLRRAGTANWPDGSVCSRFEFIHDVFRESIYQSLAAGQRQNFHHRIAECMEVGFAGEPEPVAAELALHAELGGDRLRSITFLIMAAQGAQILNAPREALAYLDRALTQLSATPAGEDRDRRELAILLQLLPSLIAVEGFTSKKLPGRVEQALALCESLDDLVSRVKVLITQTAIASLPGDWGVLERYNSELIATSETVSAPELLIHQVRNSGYLRMARGDVVGARDELLTGIALLETDESGEQAQLFGHDPTVSLMMDLITTEWLLGHADRAQSIARQALPRAEAMGAAQSLASALHASMLVALLRGEIEEARRFQDMLQQSLERNELLYCYMRPLASRVSLLVCEGRPEEAVREAQEGILLARRNGALAFSSVSLTALAEAQLAAGRFEEGLASIQEAMECAQQVGERVWLPETLRIRGRLQRAGADLRAAEASFREALLVAADHSLLALELRAGNDLVHLLQDQGREQEAYPLLEGVVNRFEEGFTTIDYRRAQSLLSACRLPAAR